MILEAGILNVREGQQDAFEAALNSARSLIATTPGFRAFDLHRCIETPNRYLLVVQWENVEAHTIGFRQSDRYRKWRTLLHDFYDPFPVIEHFGKPISFGPEKPQAS